MDNEEIKAGDRLRWLTIRGEAYGSVEGVGEDLLVRIDGGGILPLEDIIDSYSLTKL